MQTTYNKLTAAAILKTAHIGPSKAGEICIWVNIPNVGECIALLGSRSDGCGGNISDVLVIDSANRDECRRLTTTPKSLALLESLSAQAEAKQLSDLRAQGEMV